MEDKIASLLAQGLSPTDLIEQGYKKSTVYKIYTRRNRDPSATYKGTWTFENIRPSKERYMPGEVMTIWSQLRNNTPYDLYVANVGIQTEWMKGEWYPQEVRELLKPNSLRPITFTFPIPNDKPLGDYTYTFGVEGQLLGATAAPNISQHQIEWSEPMLLQVKQPKRGMTIFVSHSTENMSLVRQIENFFDIYGYDVTIAEDRSEPGVVLQEKFQRLIRGSTLVLALLTHEGLRSQWVIEETNYAHAIGKPLLLLKEDNVELKSDLEWVEFSHNASPEEICQKALEATQKIKNQTSNAFPIVGIVLLGLFLLALGSDSRK